MWQWLLAMLTCMILTSVWSKPTTKETEEELYYVPKLDVIGSFSTMLKVTSYIMHTIANLGSGLGNLLHSFSYAAHPDDYHEHLVHNDPHHVSEYNTTVQQKHPASSEPMPTYRISDQSEQSTSTELASTEKLEPVSMDKTENNEIPTSQSDIENVY